MRETRPIDGEDLAICSCGDGCPCITSNASAPGIRWNDAAGKTNGHVATCSWRGER